MAKRKSLETQLDHVANKIAINTFQATEKAARRFAKMKSAEHLTGHVQLGIGNYIRKRVKNYLFG